MNRLGPAICLLVVPLAVGSAQRPPDESAPPLTLSVTPDRARVRIPIAPRAVWSWNLPGNPEGILEYEFGIALEGGLGFSFGFSRYKYRPEPASGTLTELLQAGQLSVWQSDLSGGQVVEGARLSLAHDDSTLTLTVTDPVTLRLLFRDQPRRAVLIVQTPEEGRTRTPIRIDYAER